MKEEKVKRVAVLIVAMLVPAGLAAAQQEPAQEQPSQQPPAAQSPAQTAPPAKTPPQAKTQDESDAFQEAARIQDAQTLEAAANRFAEKYPGSGLRQLVYYRAMFAYQEHNNADKAIEMGRKVLALNPEEPVTLAMVAAMLSEKTRESDPDHDERLQEAMQDAQTALQTVETGLIYAPGTPAEQVERSKRLVRSAAYAAIGNVYLAQKDYLGAQRNLKMAIDLSPERPEAVTVLRYAIALEMQMKYDGALTALDQAIELSQPGSQVSRIAKQVRERVLKRMAAPPPKASPPPEDDEPDE